MAHSVWLDQLYVLTMVEIYKIIAYNIPLLNQIFDDKNKNGSVKGAANINQVCKSGILNLLAFFRRIFDDKKN